MRTKLEKVDAQLQAEGDTLSSALVFYTERGYSAGLIAEIFEVSGHTVRKWFKHFGLEWRKFPLQSLKCHQPEGNPELMRKLGREKARVLEGVNVPQRERELGLKRGTIGKRLGRGWAVQAALTVKKGERVVARSRKTL